MVYLLVTPESQTLFTDPRFAIQASEECTCARRRSGPARSLLDPYAIEVIQRGKLKRVGFEATRLIYDVHRRLKEALPLGTTLKPIGPVIENLRMVKTKDEIDRIRRSVQMNSQAFEKTVQSIRPGVSESHIAAELEFQMRRAWEPRRPPSETIVAAGPRSALPLTPGLETRRPALMNYY